MIATKNTSRRRTTTICRQAKLPKKLYHVTWEIHLESILQKGLIPNKNPNWSQTSWPEAAKKSKGHTYLCDSLERAEYWKMTIAENASVQHHSSQLIILEIQIQGIPVKPNSTDDNKTLHGDWRTKSLIPSGKIRKRNQAQKS